MPKPTTIRGNVGRLPIELALTPPSEEQAPSGSVKWETVLAVVGAATALGLWINVVGGAVLWTRLSAIGLSPRAVIGTVPNSLLLATGLQALVIPLVAALIAFGLFFVLSSEHRDASAHAGFPRVLLTLTLCAAIGLFLMFDGTLDGWDNPYLGAWALASSFLVVGAATYKPINSWLAKKGHGVHAAAIIGLGIAGFLGTWLVGVALDHGWAAFWVALLAPAASLLAWKLPPSDETSPSRWGGITAGSWLVLCYLGLGAALFVATGDGLSLDIGERDVALLAAVVWTSLALLFLSVIGDHEHEFRVVAGAMVAVVVLWAGIVGQLREVGVTPTAELVAVLRSPEKDTTDATVARTSVSGFLIARTGDSVVVATTARGFTEGTWRVIVIPRSQIEETAIGPACPVTAENLALAGTLAGELEDDQDSPHSPDSPGTFACAPVSE